MSKTCRLKAMKLVELSERGKSRNLSSRRKFVRDAVLSTLGASIVIGDPISLLALQTSRHVDGFLVRAKRAGLSAKAARRFSEAAELIFDAVRKDPNVGADFEVVRAWVENQKTPGSPARGRAKPGPSEQVRIAVAATYLHALSALGRNNARLTVTGLRSGLSQTKQSLESLEPNFVGQLISRASEESERSVAFAQKIDSAFQQLKDITLQINTDGVGRQSREKQGPTMSWVAALDTPDAFVIKASAAPPTWPRAQQQNIGQTLDDIGKSMAIVTVVMVVIAVILK